MRPPGGKIQTGQGICPKRFRHGAKPNLSGEVADVHRSITETYQDDFSKYARSGQLALMQQVFRTIPRIVGNKVKYSNISREDPSKAVKDVIELLAKTRICHRV